MVDKGMAVVEVADQNGSRTFVQPDDRQATQTVIRPLAQGMSDASMQNLSDAAPADVIGKVLNLTAQQAVDYGLADALADSVQGVLADLQLDQSQLTPLPGIEKTVKKYVAARRNIAEGLSRIDQLEGEVSKLNEQFTTIDNQLRTATQTNEIARGNSGNVYRSTRQGYRLSDNVGNYYGQYNNGRMSGWQSNRGLYDNQTEQRVSITTPSVDIQYVYQQLASSLQQLVGEYRRTLNLAKRWPGGLPMELTETKLQSYLDSADSELQKLNRYQPPYLYQNQQIPQVQPRVRNR